MAKSSRVIRQNGTVAASENPEHRGFSREDFTGGATPAASQQSVYPQDDTQRLSGEIRPADLRDYNGPLFVINKTSDMISHDDGEIYIRIEPKHNVDHITQLPLKVAMNRGFQKIWRQGRVRVTTDPAVEEYLTLIESPTDNGGILDYVLDEGVNKDLSPKECLICNTQIFMSKEDIDNNSPALCEIHIDSVEMIEQSRDANDKLIWKLRDTVLRRSL